MPTAAIVIARVSATHDSDWLWSDSESINVTTVGGPFSLLSFRGTDSMGNGANAAIPFLTFRVVGTFAAGGTIMHDFVSDPARPFEPFTLGTGWSGLSSVAFSTHGTPEGAALRRGGYDDIIVSESLASVVAEPASLALMGLGGFGMLGGWYGKRRKMALAA